MLDWLQWVARALYQVEDTGAHEGNAVGRYFRVKVCFWTDIRARDKDVVSGYTNGADLSGICSGSLACLSACTACWTASAPPAVDLQSPAAGSDQTRDRACGSMRLFLSSKPAPTLSFQTFSYDILRPYPAQVLPRDRRSQMKLKSFMSVLICLATDLQGP